MKYEDDIFYINQVLNGNSYSFSHLIDKHKSKVFNLAMKIIRNRETAEECVQDSFLKVFNSLSEFKSNSKFTTWLFKIVYTTAISKTRKHKFLNEDINEYEESIEDDKISSTLESLNIVDKKKYVDMALECLEPESRSIIVLYYYDDLSIEEISDITNLAIANIKTKLFRSRKKIFLELNSLLKSELMEWR